MTGTPGIEEFLEAVEELEPFTVFELSGVRTFLVCDDDLYDVLSPRIKRRYRSRLVPSNRLVEKIRWLIGAKRAVYFVLSLKSESDQLSSLRARFPYLTFKGFVGDFLTSKSAKVDPLSGPSHDNADPSQVYAVCCTARAGSTYLCELLGKSFGGDVPYENFRPSLVFLYRHRAHLNFDIRCWFDLTVRAQAKEGRFGTKVIGQFLSRMAPLIDEQDLDWIRSRIHSLKPKLIYLVREDKVEQAVSQYVAAELKFWHLRDGRNVAANQERENDYRERKQSIVYDGEAIGKHYNGMVRAEARLQTFLDQLDEDIYRVSYEGLKSDVRAAMTGILNFLDMPGTELPEDLSTSIQRGFDSKNAELVAQFKSDLAQKSDA